MIDSSTTSAIGQRQATMGVLECWNDSVCNDDLDDDAVSLRNWMRTFIIVAVGSGGDDTCDGFCMENDSCCGSMGVVCNTSGEGDSTPVDTTCLSNDTACCNSAMTLI